MLKRPRKKTITVTRLLSHYMRYHVFCVHQTLRVTPAMQAGLTDHNWQIEEPRALLPKPVVRASPLEKEALTKALTKWERG